MTDKAVAELRALIEARGRATKGHWENHGHHIMNPIGRLKMGPDGFAEINEQIICKSPNWAPNGDFIASAANWVSDRAPALLQRIERLEKALRYYADNYHDDGKCARAAQQENTHD